MYMELLFHVYEIVRLIGRMLHGDQVTNDSSSTPGTAVY